MYRNVPVSDLCLYTDSQTAPDGRISRASTLTALTIWRGDGVSAQGKWSGQTSDLGGDLFYMFL